MPSEQTQHPVACPVQASSPATNDALAKKLILKMRVRFGDAAADLVGQELVSQEVMAFLGCRAGGAGATVKEEELSILEEKIRGRLTGGTPRLMTMTMEKKAQVDGDEWAKMYQYKIAQGKVLASKEEAEKLRRQQATRKNLDEHVRMQELEKQKLKAGDHEFYLQECEKLRQIDEKQRQKEELKASIIRSLGEERIAQVREKEERISRAKARIAADELEMAEKMAFETRNELEKEERARIENKAALERFLMGNEENKVLRAEERKKIDAENEHDKGTWEAKLQKYYKGAWEAKLQKQEAERKALLDKNRTKQTLQEIAASGRAESKRWLPQEIIDRQYKAAEDARNKEEDDRKACTKAGAKAAYQTLAEQMKEREEVKRQDRERDQQAAKMVLERVQRESLVEEAKKAAAHDRKLQFKEELEAQMKDNAQRRRVAPMTSIERSLNTKVLDQVEDWQINGTVKI
ncbi:hypothetical protein FOA52_001432 [Chlamydomonas sp. UWO 241]|nr:hypothetical protein FOA52_001432 [Chlamydomonas sp. UWO 241]